MRRAVIFLGGVLVAGTAAAKPLPRANRGLWVGQFSQCSYNAIASAMVHFYGPVPHYRNRTNFEKKTFVNPLNSAGYGAYFGWAPWTSYMVDSHKMVWGKKPVRKLVAARFSLATRTLPKVISPQIILVKYARGERKKLIARLRAKLRKGPVIIWTPYAAMLGPRKLAWHQVKRVAHRVDAVPFNPSLTHSVTVFRLHGNKVLVTDCSVANGVFTTNLRTVVSVAAAMSASIRIRFNGQKSIYQRGLAGVKHDQFDVVVYPKGRKRGSK